MPMAPPVLRDPQVGPILDPPAGGTLSRWLRWAGWVWVELEDNVSDDRVRCPGHATEPGTVHSQCIIIIRVNLTLNMPLALR